ncbi:hypothetical protein B0H13DRAFT_2430255 [Mycena leptocephala]|nr:hypothetical protein B0H13DRAFT_2430255 [Mycena leptocephala]
MILLLLLAHLLNKSSSGQGRVIDPRACRTLFDIVWDCLTTIFVCTWVSVHPNVPAPNQGRIMTLGRRLRLMLLTVIAPELMVGFAARQFLSARRFSKEFKVSKTHGYFFYMGGFVSRLGNPIATRKQLDDSIVGPQYIAAIQAIAEDDIMDRSKGDALSKGVALVQVLWFTAQCLVRFFQPTDNLRRTPPPKVTELEVATLAFAVVNTFVWVLWWGKPLDVQRAILIGGTAEAMQAKEDETHFPCLNKLNLRARFFGLLFGVYSAPAGNRISFNPIPATSVPSFWSIEDTKDDESTQAIALVIECLVGTIFGIIHCIAWTADFPSTSEMWMWRLCALLVAVIPPILGFFALLAFIAKADRILDRILEFILVATVLIYIIARLFLIILAFIALRSLPLGAFIALDWSGYIPHF